MMYNLKILVEMSKYVGFAAFFPIMNNFQLHQVFLVKEQLGNSVTQ